MAEKKSRSKYKEELWLGKFRLKKVSLKDIGYIKSELEDASKDYLIVVTNIANMWGGVNRGYNTIANANKILSCDGNKAIIELHVPIVTNDSYHNELGELIREIENKKSPFGNKTLWKVAVPGETSLPTNTALLDAPLSHSFCYVVTNFLGEDINIEKFDKAMARKALELINQL